MHKTTRGEESSEVPSLEKFKTYFLEYTLWLSKMSAYPFIYLIINLSTQTVTKSQYSQKKISKIDKPKYNKREVNENEFV